MSKKRTIEEIKEKIERTTHCKLISTEYINRKTKMMFICECGNEFENTLTAMEISNIAMSVLIRKCTIGSLKHNNNLKKKC